MDSWIRLGRQAARKVVMEAVGEERGDLLDKAGLGRRHGRQLRRQVGTKWQGGCKAGSWVGGKAGTGLA